MEDWGKGDRKVLCRLGVVCKSESDGRTSAACDQRKIVREIRVDSHRFCLFFPERPSAVCSVVRCVLNRNPGTSPNLYLRVSVSSATGVNAKFPNELPLYVEFDSAPLAARLPASESVDYSE